MKRIALLVAACIVLAACGGGSGSPAPTGIAASGEELFERRVLGTNAGCITCHSLRPGVQLVGPSLSAIGLDAGDRVAGQDARSYIKESILDPEAFIFGGFESGKMPADWGDQLSAEEVDAIVEYLLTRTER